MSALALFPPSFSGRANRGLLVEARAPEEAGASLATGTERTSASALAAMQPTDGAIWLEGEGRVGAVEMEEKRADNKNPARHHVAQLAAERPRMLNFNEGKVCDAIVRRLEARANGTRASLRWPEQECHAFPVEIAFNIGDQLFALEHTGIEPFKGHVQMDAEAARLFQPINEALKDALGTDAVYELMIPANALRGRKMSEVRRIQQALIDWVKATAPTVPPGRYGDYRKTGVGPVTAPGVPFPVSLYRFAPALVPGHHFQLTHLVQNVDQLRKDRIREAVERKFPKLAAWKRDENAKTILVLEDNDIQLTNQSIVTEIFVPLATARPDRPDETYLVASCMTPWHAWPILIGDKSYFDFAQSGDAQNWEIDAAALVSLTKR